MIMPTFRDVFEAYGADYDSTMARFMGNEAMYLQLLDMLFQDENMQKLGAALANRDYTAAFEAAHTLKGVVGNMGLTPLFEAVCVIVEPLRSRECRDDYAALYQRVESEFQRAEALRKKLREGE